MRKLNKKGSDLMSKFVVELILFAILFMGVMYIGYTAFKLLSEKGSDPAIRSIGAMSQAINKLDPEYMDITRTVSIQTNSYRIFSFVDSPDLCWEDSPNCICACKAECDFDSIKKDKFCKPVYSEANQEAIFIPEIDIGPGIDNPVNYVIKLTTISAASKEYAVEAILAG